MSMDDRDQHDPNEPDVSRRQFLRGLSGSLAASAVLATGVEAVPLSPPSPPEPLEPPLAVGPRIKGQVKVRLNVNGQVKTATVEPRTTLLNTLRDDLGLTGAKRICDRGSCGGCTVIADGETIYSCMMLAVDAQGKKITTVEGLGTPEAMSPLQAAFVDHDALMCGFCTPGFVMSCTSLLKHNPDPTETEVKEACAGNICRCGTYPRIFEAVLAAAKRMRGE